MVYNGEFHVVDDLSVEGLAGDVTDLEAFLREPNLPLEQLKEKRDAAVLVHQRIIKFIALIEKEIAKSNHQEPWPE